MINKRKQAQSTIEFTISFVITLIFVVLTCNLFVWLNHCLVRRQRAYEETRVRAGRGLETRDNIVGNPGEANFYTPPRLDVFSSGGRQ